MRIESRSALRIFRGMRSTFPILFSCLAGGSAVIGASAELEAALKNFRAEAPRGWSYTQTTAAEGRSTVERSDAAKPEFDRWTLVQKDGRPPTAGETREYFENRSRRSRGGTAPKLVEQLDLSKLEALARDDIRTILGRITLGRGTAIGGNVWLTRSVPPGSIITQANEKDGMPA